MHCKPSSKVVVKTPYAEIGYIAYMATFSKSSGNP